MSAELRVHGGTAGIVARLDDLAQVGRLLRTVGAGLAAKATELAAIAASPRLQLTAAWSPVTMTRVDLALTAAGPGPDGLLMAATRAEVLGAAVTGAAAAYQIGDAIAGNGFRALAAAAGPGLAGIASAAAIPGIGPIPAGTPAPPSMGSTLLRLLCLRAPMVEAGLPLVIDAVGAGSDVIAGAVGMPAVPARTIRSPADLAALVALIGRVSGIVVGHPDWLSDGGVAVVRVGPARSIRPPEGIDDLVSPPPFPGGGPTIHVERIDDAAGVRRWVVQVPGTSQWSPRAARNPFDVSGDVRLMSGGRSAGAAGVCQALHRVGARRGEPVLLAGHSQGGMIAAAIAADPVARRELTITHVVTAGAPIASVAVPDDVQVLSLEHDDDLVPRLDAAANPAGPNWVTVSSADPERSVAPLAGHTLDGYRLTAARVERSRDPSIAAWRSGAAGFVSGSGRTAIGWNVEISRPPHPPA